MKLFQGNQNISNLKVRSVRFVKKTIVTSAVLCVILWLMLGSFKIAQHYFPRIVEAQTIVTVKDSTLSPVMQRIEKCESDKDQYGKDGQILIHVNSDGTYDIGIFEINSTHNAEATKLGYDLTKQSDNEAYAQYIYENYGTESWYSSAKCWEK